MGLKNVNLLEHFYLAALLLWIQQWRYDFSGANSIFEFVNSYYWNLFSTKLSWHVVVRFSLFPEFRFRKGFLRVFYFWFRCFKPPPGSDIAVSYRNGVMAGGMWNSCPGSPDHPTRTTRNGGVMNDHFFKSFLHFYKRIPLFFWHFDVLSLGYL